MKEPATQAVSSAEASLAAIKDTAAKYAPDALQSVESQVAALKDSLAKGDYKAVMASVPNVTSAISSLKDAATAKKAEIEAAVAQATEQWKSLGSDLPKMIEAVQSRVDILSKSKKLPRNIDKAAFESAKTGLDTMKAGWTEASSAFSSGNVADAGRQSTGHQGQRRRSHARARHDEQLTDRAAGAGVSERRTGSTSGRPDLCQPRFGDKPTRVVRRSSRTPNPRSHLLDRMG